MGEVDSSVAGIRWKLDLADGYADTLTVFGCTNEMPGPQEVTLSVGGAATSTAYIDFPVCSWPVQAYATTTFVLPSPVAMDGADWWQLSTGATNRLSFYLSSSTYDSAAVGPVWQYAPTTWTDTGLELALSVNYTEAAATSSAALETAIPTSTYDGHGSELLPSLGWSSSTGALTTGGNFLGGFDKYFASSTHMFPLCVVAPVFDLVGTVQGFTKNPQTAQGLVISGGMFPTSTFSLADSGDTISLMLAQSGLSRVWTSVIALAEMVLWFLLGFAIWRDLTEPDEKSEL